MRIRNITLLLVGLLLFATQAGAVVWTMPTLPQAGPEDRSSHQQGMISRGGARMTGSLVITAIGTPSAPVLSTNGTAGATSIAYACSGVDINGVATIPSATASITTANATLSTTNSVNVTCGGQLGAVGYLIHKVDTAHVLGICYSTSNASCTLIDDGSVPVTFTYTAPTIDQTGSVQAPGGATTFKSFHSGSSNAVVSNSAANFIPFDGVAAPQATNEGDVSTIVSNVATLKNLKCVLTTAAGVVTAAGGTSYTIALDQNLVASTATCTILTAATNCTDTTHTIVTAVGDQLDYLVTPAGTPTALVVKCSMEADL